MECLHAGGGACFIGCEMDPAYLEIAEARIRHAMSGEADEGSMTGQSEPAVEAASTPAAAIQPASQYSLLD